jgi:FkbM family methyltransferase
MTRTPSACAQYAFSFVNSLHYLAGDARLPVRLLGRVARKIAIPVARRLGNHHLVTARVYGHDLLMPAEHPIVPILAGSPQYNRPLALAAQAVREWKSKDRPLVVVDVGANIGETVAIIENACPEIGVYLCIEADREIAELCRRNHLNNDRVRVERCLIGENEGAAVCLNDDGRANPSVKLLAGVHGNPGDYDKLVRLDTVAGSFAKLHEALDLLKVDVEGYDFSIMRSAQQLLSQYHPALFFEWYPELLIRQGEDVLSGFEYLMLHGYHYYVFFTSQGDYYCSAFNPGSLFINSLAAVAQNRPFDYFDVFASTDKCEYEELIRLSVLQETNFHHSKRARFL